MATLFDTGLLQKFDFIFPFLLVLVLVWGILSYSKFMGENKFMHSLIALVLAFLVLISDDIRKVINLTAPWFVLLMFFIILVIILVKTLGTTDSQIMSVLKAEDWIIYLLIGGVILIFAIASAQVFVWDKEAAEEGSSIISGGEVGDESMQGAVAVLRNPQVLGLVFIFLIAAISIHRLTKFT